jgi:leucyl-tRNA synthetase
MAPFAPHLAEELWHRLGGPFSVHTQPWPECEETAPAEEAIEIPVQIDGKLRGTITLPGTVTEEEAAAVARSRVAAASTLDGARVVYVPGRVVNFVTVG